MLDAATTPQNKIDAALRRGAAVLVPTRHAAHALRRNHLRQEQGTLEQPLILTWQAWTSRLWHRALLNGADDRLLLNRTQEQTLWRGLLEQEPAVLSLRDPASLALLAGQAWDALAQHRGLGRLAGSATNADTETFLRLATAFDQRCRRDGFLSQARLESALRQAMLANRLSLEQQDLLLCGFGHLLPAQHALLDAVRHRGGTVEILPCAEPARDLHLLATDDEPQELRAAALWCRDRLQEQPGCRIAVVVPGLAEKGRAAGIDRVFRELLAPAAEAIDAPAASLPYEIACAEPLAETSLAAGALDLLAWSTGPLAIDRAGSLLLSPWLGGGQEQAARAEFDAYELRRSHILRPEVELDWLLRRLLRSPRRERLEGLIAGLRAMQTVTRRRFGPDERRSWGEWAEAVRELLSAAGWARKPAVDAAALAVQRAWESALDELATLDFDGHRVAWVEALTTLRAIAAETVLPPPFRDASVQVIAPEETAAMSFDAVWFLRAGDLSWPIPERDNPLLGWPLRRELGMPGADSAIDRTRAREMTEAIAGSAGKVVFSYACETLEGRQRPSPALQTLAASATSRATPTYVVDTEPQFELEAIPDNSRIPPPPDGAIPGGAAVLRVQAACGFRAFAEQRLGATELEMREPGMNQRERGIAVHRMLERFWESVETQAALLEMPPLEREARLAESVELALAEALDGMSTPWDKAYLETQRQRLMTLGRRWLEIEAARTVPFTVARRESETRDRTIGPLRLSLRVDRVDHTEYGAVLIDYKTGKAAHGDWLGDRPDEPQLPLYAVLAGESLQAIAFGTVRPGKNMLFTGYEERAGTLTKPVKPDVESLQAQIEAWALVLTQLATDFWSGDTRVSPKNFPATCKHCAQRLLCRLDAASISEGEQEEPAEDGGLGEEDLPG